VFEKSVENHFFDCMLSAQEIRTLIDELGEETTKGFVTLFFSTRLRCNKYMSSRRGVKSYFLVFANPTIDSNIWNSG